MVNPRQRVPHWPFRKLFALLILLAIACGISWYVWPDTMNTMAGESWQGARNFWYTKEVRISGMAVLREENLELQAARNRSVLWWHMNLNNLRSVLRQNPLVREAAVRRCPDNFWNCFEVVVIERQPSLLAFVGERLWMVGDDGGFMGPVSSKLLEAQDRSEKLQKIGGTPLVRGLLTEGASPDLLKLRLSYVLQALQIINEKSGLSVSEVNLRPSGEMEVKVLGHGFVVIFGTARSDMEEITEEARRLVEILARFKDNPSVIESIDLAFNKRAVVKLAQKETS